MSDIEVTANILTTGVPSPWIDVEDYASFIAAIDAIGATERTLLIASEQAVADSKTVPSNVTLKFLQGGSLNIADTKIVTINGHVEAELYQIFKGDGTVAFGVGVVKKIYPQWWGSIGDDSNNDTASMQEALTAASGKTLCVPSGTYKLTAQLTSPGDKTSIVGDGMSSSVLKFYACDGLSITHQQITLRDIMFWQNTQKSSTAIEITGAHGATIANYTLNNVWLYRWNLGLDYQYAGKITATALRINQGNVALYAKGECVNNFFTNCFFEGEVTSPAASSCMVKIEYDDGEVSENVPEGNCFDNCLIMGGETGVRLNRADYTNFSQCMVDFCKKYGFLVKDCHHTDIKGGYVYIGGTVDGACIKFENAGASYYWNQVMGVHLVSAVEAGNTTGIWLGTDNDYSNISENTLRENDNEDIRVDSQNNMIKGNICTSATPANGNINLTDLTGNKVKNNITKDSTDIASAATITLPQNGEYFNITGTVNITSVTASWAGRRVVLKFAAILTFTDGSNLKIAGNFVTSADDCISLVCNGVNWYEETRSAN